MKRNIANIITFLRIPLAILMFMSTPFSISFWCFYLCAGFTDIIDGTVARKMHQESFLGAKLDSLSDLVFGSALTAFIIMNIKLPVELWFCILAIALIRFISYGIGFYKFHTFSALHTYANKITGALIFISPILFYILGTIYTCIFMCIMSVISAVEELVIIVRDKELNRNCVSVFIHKKS